jgi:hypothetical protein
MLRPVASLATPAEAGKVSPITWSWPVVVAVAAAAAFVRVVLEERVMAGPHGPMITELKRKRWSGQRRPGILRHVPKFVRRSASVLLLLFIFGGTFSSWTDIVITAVLVIFVFIARTRLIARLPGRWTERITKIPVLVRFTAALVVGYAISAGVISLMWSEATMQSVTISTLLSLTLFAVCFPEAAQRGRAKPAEYTAAAATVPLGCAVIAFVFGSAVAAHAQGF